LAEIEQHTLALVKDVGQQVLAGVSAGVVTPPNIRCACGQ